VLDKSGFLIHGENAVAAIDAATIAATVSATDALICNGDAARCNQIHHKN